MYARPVGGQEPHRLGHLVGGGGPAERHHGGELLDPVLAERRDHVGRHHARAPPR